MSREHSAVSPKTTAWSVSLPLLGLGLFGLALLPRLVGLQHFVTADEAKWVYRSAQFWLALLRGDWAGTLVNPTPAVTTLWSGGLGLLIHNLFGQGLPPIEFLTAIPEWQVDPVLLQAARLPTVVLSALFVVAVFFGLRSWLGEKAALLSAALLAIDPLFLAHSRFLHHDALVTVFAVLALLLALPAARGNRAALLGSGLLAGLAFLTKSPLFFLAPVVLLIFAVEAWRQQSWPTQAVRFALWALLSYLGFVLFWPAAWVAPIAAPLTVIGNAFESAGRPPEPEYFLQLGMAYYPVYWLYYSTPVVLLGIVLGLRSWPRFAPETRWALLRLSLFALGFVVLLSLSDKRSARYALPAFVALIPLAASGWLAWWDARRPKTNAETQRRRRRTLLVGLLMLQFIFVAPHAPYYLTYLNPLLGGALTAPQVIKLGWGEGMDQVAAWLNQRPTAAADRVGAAYATTLSAFYPGNVAEPDAARLDYVVDYIKQRQSAHPAEQAYWMAQPPLHTVHLAGVPYARVYPGPALFPTETVPGLRGYRPRSHVGPIGGHLLVDLVWAEPPVSRPPLTMQRDEIVLSAEGASFALPATLPVGDYELYLGDVRLGDITVAYVELPAGFTPHEADFGGEVTLRGLAPPVMANNTAHLRLAFQAAPRAWADYTLYVHLVDAAGNRLAGHDAQPLPPTSRWSRHALTLVEHSLPLPPDLPPGQYGVRLGFYHPDTGAALGEAALLPPTLTLP